MQKPAAATLGRSKAGLDSERRSWTCRLPEPTISEMLEILVHQGRLLEEAMYLVYDFVSCQQYSRAHQCSSEPEFRHLKASGENKLLKIVKTPLFCPLVEDVLYDLVDLDNPSHRALLVYLRERGYENIFYQGFDNNIYFHKDGPVGTKPRLLDLQSIQELLIRFMSNFKPIQVANRFLFFTSEDLSKKELEPTQKINLVI